MSTFNQLVTNGLSHPYHLDESTFILGAAGVTFHFYFAFYYAEVTHSRTGCRISHGYNPASFVAIRIGP